MAKETQVSALISVTTRQLMEKRVRQTGIKKGHLIEQALLHHLQALDALPSEYVIHPRVVVSRNVGAKILDQSKVAAPTANLRRLMQDGD